tara:strand:+ start:336 stop:488 length:153 start_codon:yes stop_codon:yes gene_type:complete
MSFIYDESGATAIEYALLSGIGFVFITITYVVTVERIVNAMNMLTAAITV